MVAVSEAAPGVTNAKKEPAPQAPGRAPAAPGSAPATGSDARPTLPASLFALQRTAGNAAVSALLASHRRPAQTAQPGAGPLPTVQRRDPDADPSTNPAPAGDGGEKTGIEKIREINAEAIIDFHDEWALEEEWSKLGPEGANAHPEDFAKSIKEGMEPDNLAGASQVLDDFKTAVRTQALIYLDGNLAAIAEEEKRLGIGAKEASPQADARVNELVVLANKAKDLDELLKAYRRVHVGYDIGIKQDEYAPREQTVGEVEAYFTPGKPPEKPLKGKETNAAPYEQVAGSYEKTMGGLLAIANQHPSIYAAYKKGTLGAIAGTDENKTDPRAEVKTILDQSRGDIAKTKVMVETGDLDWEELKPLHTQLLRGEKMQGGHDWKHPWNQAIVKEEVGDYEEAQTMMDIGIGLAAAVAFIFAELATGGMATVLFIGGGLAIGGANVARKYEKYDDLKTAAGAGTSTATELVSQGQVDAAKLDLIIEAAFMMFDAIGVAVKGVKGAAGLAVKAAGGKAAEEAAGLAALKGVSKMGAEEAGPIVAKSIDQLGAKKAADTAGMTVEQLLAKVPPDSPAAAKLKDFLKISAEGVAAADLPKALKDVLAGKQVVGKAGKELTAEAVVKQAIDELGIQGTLKEAGGWKTVSAALGPTSEVGQRLKAWRDGVYQDLKRYIETLRTPADGEGPLVQETGTLKDVTNDLDISFLGPRASENKAKAAQFLGGRTGMGGDPGLLDKMVYIGLFTDPRRMHLFDQFPQLQEKLAQRTMKFEEELIWNDEYWKAMKKGGKGDTAAAEMAKKIGAEMDTLRVQKLPDFTPLGERAADVLSREQDKIHQAIEAAVNSNNLEQAEKLIEQLAVVQSQINVKEGGGYFSAGGVRKFVTDKENFPGARVAATGAHDLGAALDQVNKLRKAIAAFEKEAVKAPGTRDVAELSKHIKDLAKYGDRFTSAASVLGGKMPNGAAFAEAADEFGQLILLARGEGAHTMQQLLARNMEGVLAKVRTATSAYDEVHVAVIRALRERAGIEGIGELAPDILAATRARYAWLTAQAALVAQMDAAARAVGIPLQHAVREDAEGAPGDAGAEGPQKGDFPTPKGDAVPV